MIGEKQFDQKQMWLLEDRKSMNVKNVSIGKYMFLLIKGKLKIEL